MYLQIVFQRVEYILSPRISENARLSHWKTNHRSSSKLITFSTSKPRGVIWHLTVAEEMSETNPKFGPLANKFLLKVARFFFLPFLNALWYNSSSGSTEMACVLVDGQGERCCHHLSLDLVPHITSHCRWGSVMGQTVSPKKTCWSPTPQYPWTWP